MYTSQLPPHFSSTISNLIFERLRIIKIMLPMNVEIETTMLGVIMVNTANIMGESIESE
jgi:hypothetical protein